MKSADKEMAAKAAVVPPPPTHTHLCVSRQEVRLRLSVVGVGGTISQETMETLDVF